jgi:hypothetical protein
MQGGPVNSGTGGAAPEGQAPKFEKQRTTIADSPLSEAKTVRI